MLVVLFVFFAACTGCGCGSVSSRDAVGLVRESGVKNGSCSNISSIVLLPFVAGRFLMGDDAALYPDGEGPAIWTNVETDYSLAETETTVMQFREFVKATGYVTSAERFGWSFVFETLVPLDDQASEASEQAPWWVKVLNATFEFPFGPKGERAKDDEPVVHVSWIDAVSSKDAFCRHYGMRLPSEAEWEKAARGSLHQASYPWGNEFKAVGSAFRANVFTGSFPETNTAADGFVGVAPVKSFPANHGLYEMVGNVWEWVHDFDTRSPLGLSKTQRVEKGGSYLCHRSYCFRYKVSSRSAATPDSSLGHLGFRCAK